MAGSGVKSFPSLAAARWAYERLWQERQIFLPVAGVWAAAVVIAIGLLMLAGGVESDADPAMSGESVELLAGIAGLPSLLISWLGLSSVVVFWQRRFLNDVPPPLVAAPLDRGVMAYMATEVLLGLLAAIPLLLLATFAGAFSVGEGRASLGTLALPLTLGMVVAGVLLARFHLILPAVAADRPRPSLRASWETTSGNTIRIVAGAMAGAAPIVLVSIVVDAAFDAAGAGQSLTAAAITTILEFVQVSVMGGYLAFSYRFFVPATGETGSQA